jgi:hypothetical protein
MAVRLECEETEEITKWYFKLLIAAYSLSHEHEQSICSNVFGKFDSSDDIDNKNLVLQIDSLFVWKVEMKYEIKSLIFLTSSKVVWSYEMKMNLTVIVKEVSVKVPIF